MRGAVREDARAIDGMARFPEATSDMPWRADRPAIAFYDKLASDARLSARRSRATRGPPPRRYARSLLSHRESDDFKAFGGSDYSDAVGPTVHLPTSRRQIDPWASAGVTETDNAFYDAVDEDAMTRVIS